MNISVNDFVFECDPNSPGTKSELSALSRTNFYHYTNFESFLKIISTQKLKFNRIDLVNDQTEKTYFKEEEFAKLVFIACFTYSSDENIPIWHMYTGDSQGLRLGFHLKTPPFKPAFSLTKENVIAIENNQPISLSHYSDWHPTLSQRDIIYHNNDLTPYNLWLEKPPTLLKEHPSQSRYMYNLTSTSMLKDTAWTFEEETRLTVILRTTKDNISIPNINFLLIPIDFEVLDSISITFSPWMSDELKCMVKKSIQHYLSNFSSKFIYNDSRFEGSIIKK